jgi:integrase
MASVEKRMTTRGARYDVRYRDPSRRVRMKTFRRRADAERFARKVEADKDRGLFIDPALARKLLAEVAAAWLASNPGKRGGSWQRDEIAVRRHVVPALGACSIGSVTPADVQEVVNAWASQRGARTVRRDYGVLRAVFNYAVSLDMIGRSPCRGIGLPEVVPVRPHVVSVGELRALADGLGGVGRYGPMVYLGSVLGLRWGEAAGLKVGRLDFEASTLAVVETVVRGRGGVRGAGEPKSAAGRRVLAVPKALMDMLRAHVRERGLHEVDAGAFLFENPRGGMLSYSNWLHRWWWPAAEKAGVGHVEVDEVTGRKRYKGLGFHDLRRANATGLLAEGVDVKTAQALLGHSDARLTLDVYAQAVAELGRAAAEALGARFMGAARDERAMEAERDPTKADPDADADQL